MALEPPLTVSAQARLQELRQQIDAALEGLVADMLALATAEQDTAISEARAAVLRETDKELAKVRAESEATIAEHVAAARVQAAEAAKDAAATSVQDRLAAVEAQAARSLAEAVAATEERAAQTLAAERAQLEQRVTDAQAETAACLAATRAEERQCDLACLEQMLDAIRDLDAAASLSQVLDRLADHAAAHVARVAVLVVRDHELRGWRVRGFDHADADPSAVTVPLEAATVVGRAVETGARATTSDTAGERLPEPLAFATLPGDRVGLAVPLNVGVRTVAVLYADEGAGEPIVPSAWPEALEILARHAASRLELLTMAKAYAVHAPQQANSVAPGTTASVPARRDRAMPADEAPPLTPPPGGRPPSLATDSPVETSVRPDSLRQVSEEDSSALRYARLLISEIKLYHEDAVNAGRRDGNLLARLGSEIARARRLYEERVPADVRSRADHFGQELVRTLANGDPRLLGQAT
jgi:hypothetical protein